MAYHIWFILFFSSNLFSQQQVVLTNSVFININNNAHVVLDNANANAIIVSNAGNIISEGENNVLKWMIQNNTGNYVVPFATNSFSNTPLQVNVITAGVGGNSSILFSTYETVTDKNTNYPSDVTNLNSNCRDSVGLFTIDRFWRIDAQNYITKPTPIITFGYDNSANEIGGSNTITESKLKAMRFNNTINSWETPQKLYGITNTSSKTVSLVNVSPTDFYKSWALVDSSIMNIPISVSTLSNNTFCAGGTATISPSGATSYTLFPDNIISASNFTVMPTVSITYTILGSIGNGSAICTSNSANSPTVSITINNLPTVTSSITAIKCFGDHTGSVVALVSSNATYTWSNGSHASSITGLSAGNYSLVVMDDNGCTANYSLAITQPSLPLSLMLSNQNVLCYGQANGSAAANAMGGTPSYNYTWQPNGIINNTISNLATGAYTVFATDANGCKTNSVLSITEPNMPLQVLISDSVKAHCGQPDGSLLVDATGGTANYDYQWLPVFSNNASLQNISTGSYTVIVTDANGCQDVLAITLGCEKNIVIPQLFTPNADGKNDLFVIEGLERYPNNKITIYNRWGSLVYLQQHYQNNWSGRANVINSEGAGKLPAATYFVVVDFGEGSDIKSYSGFVELRY